jgi:hypothetical protein
LNLLLKIAKSEKFDVGVVYQALNFSRRPQPIATVRADMTYLVSQWGKDLQSATFGRPVIIWTGTDNYSTSEVRSVHAALAGRAVLLAASKTVNLYERVASYVDGEAYYWSSADPRAASTAQKLTSFAETVHAHHGLWIAPAAPGFDGRPLGHSRNIGRDGGKTLVDSLDNAFASNPDAVGVISWNEWSENTYIEPGKRYKKQELDALSKYLVGKPDGPPVATSATANKRNWSGLQALSVLVVVSSLGICFLILHARRTQRDNADGANCHVPQNLFLERPTAPAD